MMNFPVLPIAPVLPTAGSTFARLPAGLDGSQGRNRGTGHRQLEADNDVDAVRAWLDSYATGSPATLASYRKEVERLFLWATLQQRKALSDLTHEDFAAYRAFLSDPQPASYWVMACGKKAGRSSPGWRPFAGPLSQASQQQAMTIINNLFSWLVSAGYLAGNPLSLQRGRRAGGARGIRGQKPRALADELWRAIKQTIYSMPRDSAKQARKADQVRWLFCLLYLGGLRISEVANGSMGWLVQSAGSDGVARWWLHVLGKGSKEREVPVTPDLLDELGRYRTSLGLAPRPHVGERTPLVASVLRDKDGNLRSLTRAAVHQIVKEVAETTAERLRPGAPALADYLAKMSAHWIRHTAASRMSDSMDLKFVRDNLGHANISTTNIYLHGEENQRHDATAAVHRMDWGA